MICLNNTAAQLEHQYISLLNHPNHQFTKIIIVTNVTCKHTVHMKSEMLENLFEIAKGSPNSFTHC